jgi:hypothetical protein
VDTKRARLDSRLEADGAEFLVLAHLLLERILAIKAYTRFPDCDVVAADPHYGSSCRIQVSRWATDYDRAFPLKNFECDFVVLAALNRGYSYRKQIAEDGRRPPELFVFPIEILKPRVFVAGG